MKKLIPLLLIALLSWGKEEIDNNIFEINVHISPKDLINAFASSEEHSIVTIEGSKSVLRFKVYHHSGYHFNSADDITISGAPEYIEVSKTHTITRGYIYVSLDITAPGHNERIFINISGEADSNFPIISKKP